MNNGMLELELTGSRERQRSQMNVGEEDTEMIAVTEEETRNRMRWSQVSHSGDIYRKQRKKKFCYELV